MRLLHVPLHVNLALWCLCLATLAAVLATYAAKCALYFEAVRREFCHPVRINFFFAPWIAAMFLALGLPPRLSSSPPPPALWGLFMAPIFLLELKIYGQWLSGGEKRLCKVIALIIACSERRNNRSTQLRFDSPILTVGGARSSVGLSTPIDSIRNCGFRG
jgi:hypothetical protein